MSEIALVKTTDRELSDQERYALMTVLFGGYVDGMGDEDKADWKRFWSTIKNMEPGEIIKFTFKKIRNGKFHRRFFAMLNVGFEFWEPARKNKKYKGMAVTKNFDQFRSDILILSGFYVQTFNLKGELKLVAKSMSFSNMDQLEFERVYSSVCDVLLQKVLTTYKGRDELDEVVNRMIGFM